VRGKRKETGDGRKGGGKGERAQEKEKKGDGRKGDGRREKRRRERRMDGECP
jgi:hypothetical protein